MLNIAQQFPPPLGCSCHLVLPRDELPPSFPRFRVQPVSCLQKLSSGAFQAVVILNSFSTVYISLFRIIICFLIFVFLVHLLALTRYRFVCLLDHFEFLSSTDKNMIQYHVG